MVVRLALNDPPALEKMIAHYAAMIVGSNAIFQRVKVVPLDATPEKIAEIKVEMELEAAPYKHTDEHSALLLRAVTTIVEHYVKRFQKSA